jgi:hypothetical protein
MSTLQQVDGWRVGTVYSPFFAAVGAHFLVSGLCSRTQRGLEAEAVMRSASCHAYFAVFTGV